MNLEYQPAPGHTKYVDQRKTIQLILCWNLQNYIGSRNPNQSLFLSAGYSVRIYFQTVC